MKYVCPELEALAGNEAIIKTLFEAKSADLDPYDTPTGNYLKFFTRKFFKGNLLSNEYYFGNKISRLFQQTFRKRIGYWKLSTMFSAWGITLEDNTGTSAYLWKYNGTSPSQLKSGFFWTVYTETGIKLFKPYRTGLYAGVVQDNQILGNIINAQTNNNYQGETSADYTISADTDIIQPTIIDSTLKSMARNKKNSADNTIIFQSGLELEPGQWVQYGTNSYIVLSRRYDANTQTSVYMGALESNTTYTFSAASVAEDSEHTDTMEPMGFINRTDSTITYDLATRTLTISGTFEYYHRGKKYIKNNVSESLQHGSSIGQYFYYYNGETLTVNAVNVPWSILTDAMITLVYYNSTAATTNWSGAEAILLEERHGVTMSAPTHKEFHYNYGTYVPGTGLFGLTGLSLSSGADLTYGCASGYIADEDIETYIAAIADSGGVGTEYPCFYRSGSGQEWRWTSQAKPCIFSGSNPQYNQLTGGSYQLTSITSNNTYFNMFLCAMPFLSSTTAAVNYRFVWVIGQTTYTTQSAAAAATFKSELSFAGFPSAEIRPLHQVIMKFSTAGGGTTTIEQTIDVQAVGISLSGTGGTSDHNILSNRSAANQHPASSVSTDTTLFNGILTSSQTTVQLALDRLDGLILPEGYMINGQISAAVASNNLTVSLLTLAGTAPSATDPVLIRLGGVIRVITAALTVTKNAGTNWFNSGGTELATKERDYFVYLGYNATDGVVIGFAATSYQTRYSEFSTTTTNERYCAISTITNAAATDYYSIVGRFAATLSAGAGYTWTVPTFTAINLVNYPIWNTRWLLYQPVYSASGSMTFTSVATDYVRYQIQRDICYVILRSTGTTGGTASTQILVTLPFLPSGSGGSNNTMCGSAVNDGGLKSGATVIQASTLATGTLKYDNTNWSLGSGRQVYLDFFYSII